MVYIAFPWRSGLIYSLPLPLTIYVDPDSVPALGFPSRCYLVFSALLSAEFVF